MVYLVAVGSVGWFDRPANYRNYFSSYFSCDGKPKINFVGLWGRIRPYTGF